MSILALQDDRNGQTIVELMGLPPAQGKVIVYKKVIWNPGLFGKHFGHPRMKDLLQLINSLENGREDQSRFFFFDLEKSLQQKNLQIFYVSYDNLLKIVGDSMLHKVPDSLDMVCGFILKQLTAKSREKSASKETKSRAVSNSLMKKRLSITSDKLNKSYLSSGYRVESSHRTATILNTSKHSSHKPKPKIGKLFGSEAKVKLQSLIEKQLDSDQKSFTKRNYSSKSRNQSREIKLSTGSRQTSQSKRKNQLLGPLNSFTESVKKSFLLSSPKASVLKTSTPKADKPAGPLFFRKENGVKKQKAKEKEFEGYYVGENGQNMLSFGGKPEKKATKEEDKMQPQSGKVADMFEINKDHLLKMFATQGGMKDIGSHSFLSKFSLLSSKTSIGESGQSFEKKKEAVLGYGPATPSNQRSPKAELFRASFLNKKK